MRKTGNVRYQEVLRVFLRTPIRHRMHQCGSLPRLPHRHERAFSRQQMDRRGPVHRPSRRFDRLRLAPHRRRGHRSRYVASMGENVLMPRRSHSGLTDCLLPRVPEEVHRLHSVCHLCNQHPGSLHPRFSAYGRQRHRGRLHGRRRTMEHHQRHSRHLKRRLHLRILRHHRQPR